MTYRFHQLVLGLVLAATSTLMRAQSAPVADARGVLHDASGMTLYTYDPDTPGRSVCSGPCAKIWPPVIAAADARPHGAVDLAVRDDGSHQWALHGHPLYGYVADVTPGQASGDGVNGRWHVARISP
jgi:predicted lipoprotein with Yx(FWY)xxD motif